MGARFHIFPGGSPSNVRKVLIVSAVSTVALVAAVLVAPSFVDWNAYKDKISSAAFDATGRRLAIDGDISLSVLPAPKLVVRGVRLANLEGGKAADMARLKALDVRVSLPALVRGKVQVQSVTLVDPVVSLEVLADGRKNWELTPPAKEGETRTQAGKTISLDRGPVPGGDGEALPDVRLDNLTVSGGTVVYLDSRSGVEETLNALNAAISVGSLTGPVESSGSANVRGIPVTFAVSAGKMIEGRTVPVNASIQIDAGHAKATISGVALDLNRVPRFKGKFSVQGSDLAAVAAGLGSAGLPASMAKSFGVEGEVTASPKDAQARDVVLAFGNMRGAANVDLAFADTVGIGAAVHFGQIDLDALTAVDPAAVGDKAAKGKSVDGNAASGSPTGSPASSAGAGFALPGGVAASLALTVDSVALKGGAISNVRLNAELVNGEITVSQVAAQLPGSSDVAAFGFITAKGGKPRFEGEVEASVADTRGIARWLGADMAGVPADRLRNVTAKASLAASPDEAQVTKMKVSFDGTTVTGAVAVKPGTRPSFGADVSVDKINLDAYLGAPAPKGKSPAKSMAKVGAQTAPASASQGSASAAVETWKALSALTMFDANLKAHVKEATMHGVPVHDVVVDATLYNGALTLKRASIGDAAGASANVTGTVKGLGGIPDLQGVSVALAAGDVGRLMKVAGETPPPALKGLGLVKVAAQLSGSVVAPAVKATVDAASGRLGVDGKLNLLPIGTGFKGTLSAAHPDARALLTAFGGGYRPSGALGDLSLSGQLDAAPDAVSLNGMAARIGKTTLAGDTTLGLGGARPKLTATLKGGEILLDPFLPAQRTAAVDHASGLVPAAFAVPGQAKQAGAFHHIAVMAAARAQRWPTTPLDLSGLKAIDADVALNATAMVSGGYRLDNADVRLTLKDGLLKVSRLNGGLFGGTLVSAIDMDGRAASAKASQTVAVKGVDLARLTQAATGQPLTTGILDLDVALSATGRSVSDLVGSLGGNGKAALSGMDVRKGAKGSPFAPILDLFLGLNQLGGSLTGGKAGGKADVSASFTAANGIFTTNDVKLTSGLGDGSAAGKVDLAGWQVDMKGEVNMSRNVLGALLASKGNLPSKVPFSVHGTLDSPNVKIEGGATAGGVAAPAIEKLLGNRGGAAGALLQGILGGGAPQSGTTQQAPSTTNNGGTLAPPPPAPTQQQQPTQKKIDPRQLLKGLLGR